LPEVKDFKIVPIDAKNILDRIRLCWGHIDNWKDSKIVQESKEWLEKSNSVFKPTTFISYVDNTVVGIIEFLPQRLMKQLGLCPCRANPEQGKIEKRYSLGKDFDNYLFISCLYVSKEHQGKGVGKALLNHLLSSKVFRDSDGVTVYVAERDKSWESYISWPTGSKEFYLKSGFAVEKNLESPKGYVLSYSKVGQAHREPRK
jgi:ribosomal protein S18 acetylase RimI-like enzyme